MITTPLQENRNRFVKTILVTLIIVFTAAGVRFMSEKAKADKAEVSIVTEGEPGASPLGPLIEDGPTVQASVTLVRELGGLRDIVATNPQMRWPLASITKLMTATVALEKLSPASVVTFSQSAVDTEGVAGSFKAGERYTVSDLVTAALTVSSNDAATMLAEAYDASVSKPEEFQGVLSKTAYFVEMMNKKAADIGMKDTLFGDSTGLSMVSQSTAHDLAILVKYINTVHPQIFEITRKKENKITERSSGRERVLNNINLFAGRTDFLGGKTGRTDESGDNLISLFAHKDTTYMIVVFGAQDRFKETQRLLDFIKKTY